MEALSIFFKSLFILIVFLLGTVCKVIISLCNGVLFVLEKTLLVLMYYFGGVGILILLTDVLLNSGGIWKSLISIIVTVGIIALFVTKGIKALCRVVAKGIKYIIDLVCKYLDNISEFCDDQLRNLLTSLGQ